MIKPIRNFSYKILYIYNDAFFDTFIYIIFQQILNEHSCYLPY